MNAEALACNALACLLGKSFLLCVFTGVTARHSVAIVTACENFARRRSDTVATSVFPAVVQLSLPAQANQRPCIPAVSARPLRVQPRLSSIHRGCAKSSIPFLQWHRFLPVSTSPLSFLPGHCLSVRSIVMDHFNLSFMKSLSSSLAQRGARFARDRQPYLTPSKHPM
jgi:hypothetical protein